MEEWKFLLQKDGDRSWLPLDSPDAEILEGRYRLVARSAQTNTDIGIRICHLATEEDPPKRRIQKRSSRTNENGLMVVIPFTYLRAGSWEISCFSTDPMSDLMGDTLHHTICLSVAAPITETELTETDLDDWNSSSAVASSDVLASVAVPGEKSEEAITASSPSEIAAATPSLDRSQDRMLDITEQLPHQVVEEAFREFHWGTEVGAIASNISNQPAFPEPSKSEVSPAPVETSLPVLNVSTLRLQLERTTLTASRGQTFTLAGQIVVDDLAQLETEIPVHWLQSDIQEEALSTATEVGSTAASAPAVIARELHLCLRDPQSSTILIHEQQAFPSGTPPFNFKFSISLPHTLATFLLLGEVVLYGSQPDRDEAAIALQVISFTVTVDPENLVEELKKVNAALDKAMLEDGSRGAELADLAVQFSLKLRRDKLKSPLDLSFFNLTTPTSAAEEQSSIQPVSHLVQTSATQVAIRPFTTTSTDQATLKQILPPQLHVSPERLIGKKYPELPIFDRCPAVNPALLIQNDSSLDELFTSAAAPVDDTVVPQTSALEEFELAESVPEQPPLETPSLETLTPDAVLEETAIAQPTELLASDALEPTEAESTPPEVQAPELAASDKQIATHTEPSQALPLPAQEENPTSPIQLEFQALKLEERFLDRLNQLAGDAALIASLKRSVARPAVETTSPLTQNSGATRSSTFLESGAMAREVVVEDDLSWRDEVPRSPRRRLNLKPDAAPNQLLVLPEDTPVPTPVVEILTDAIIAEGPIRLRVKLPDITPKLAIKLWISDRQTRTLLDGPRWLTDFSPNGFDQVETNLEITAPQGSLDIRIEAIAVELQTQRESQKTGLERSVTPADLPDLWDDDLGF